MALLGWMWEVRFPSLRLHTSRGRYPAPSKCTSRIYLCSCVLYACVFALALRWHAFVCFALAEAAPFGVSVHRYNQYANQCDAAGGVMGGTAFRLQAIKFAQFGWAGSVCVSDREYLHVWRLRSDSRRPAVFGCSVLRSVSWPNHVWLAGKLFVNIDFDQTRFGISISAK